MGDRWVRVTVLRGCVGCRTVAVPATATGRDLKERIFAETSFPVAEQRLWRGDREIPDWIKIGDLTSKTCHLFVNLQSKGLKGGGRFGQTTPPLVDFLKDILRRYPEGGQILKELIQNAEDAGATEVKFLYDETQYGTETLWSKDMAQYQGSALYVYNNAVFTPEDWHGIQEIARSRKKDDPLKVGRFGIGFNSVYHITDVPCIFSGDQIGMLDPHQTLFGPHESGQCWNLKDDIKEINELPDQFAPFIGVFGSTKETFTNGSFPGTFFRFPLRLQPSQLSSNLYTKQKVLELFDSFRADADTVLLFLKSVQAVSLHVREADGTEKLVFRVTASENKALKHERPNSIKILGTAISNYCKKIPSNSVTCVTYHINIVLEQVHFSELDGSLESTRSVLNYLQSSGKQIAKVPGNLAAAVQLSAASATSSASPVRKVTPAWVRQVLRKCAHLGSAEEKLHLLEFVLSDQAYSELLGLELLPLQSGAFVPFSSSVSDQDVVYITSEEFPRSLFPGLEARLILENLKPHLLAALKEAAQTRGYVKHDLLTTLERISLAYSGNKNSDSPSRRSPSAVTCK